MGRRSRGTASGRIQRRWRLRPRPGAAGVTPRKTPILLRRSPLSGEVRALYRYSRKTLPSGREVIDCGSDGRWDVSHDYDALMLTELVDNGAEDIVGILDGVADGEPLTDDERAQVRVLRERLKTAIERHNTRLGSPPSPESDRSA